jgi:hypothetical protein
LQTRLAGAFLFLPLLARLGFDQLVASAGYPGSVMIPATSALLSLLLLKLLDKERHSHVNDFNFDQALGLFAGLNILPKKSFLSEYSYRTSRDNQVALLKGWVGGLAGLLFPQADTFSVDFHPMPHRGLDAELEQHFLSTQGRARPSIMSFFALEHCLKVMCYANANLTRDEQSGQVLQFVEFWQQTTGRKPAWLYFDSRVTTYPELEELDRRDISFVTIRRRGEAIVRELLRRPATDWRRTVIDTPRRRNTSMRYIDEEVSLRGYKGKIRQIAVAGLGKEQPTLMLSNNKVETARQVIIRYAGRNRIEDGLGSCVNFMHLDCLSSDVRLNVDVDVALAVLASGCYRWLASQLKGYEQTSAKRLYRLFVETAGGIEIQEGRLLVYLARRSHIPILREAALDLPPQPIPWLGNLCVSFSYS